MLYFEREEKPAMVEMGVERVADLNDFISRCDIVSINIPLTDSTKGMFNKDIISKMKKVRQTLPVSQPPFCCVLDWVDDCTLVFAVLRV